MFIIYSSNQYKQEKEYIIETIFEEFLGLEFRITWRDIDGFEIRYEFDKERCIKVDGSFFEICNQDWLTEKMLPIKPLSKFSLSKSMKGCIACENEIPVIYGDRLINGDFVEINANLINIGLDIFGSSFFMLSRIEEYIIKERDKFDRFSAFSSLAYKEKFLDRPIVNEYVEIFWWAIKYLWPHIKRKERNYNFLVTHDVDDIYFYFNLPKIKRFKRALSELINSKSLNYSYRMGKQIFSLLVNSANFDINNTFNFMLDMSKKYNLKTIYYFLSFTEKDKKNPDIRYFVNEKSVKLLIKKIEDQGHQVGLHGGLDTYIKKSRMQEELNNLVKASSSIGIQQNIDSCRQHYLKVKLPDTFNIFEELGLRKDSTLGFADMPGFRAGTCYPYHIYDFINRKPLDIIETPLIVMEATLFTYLKLNNDEFLSRVKYLADRCKVFKGDFVLLWHNKNLYTKKNEVLYEKVLKACL